MENKKSQLSDKIYNFFLYRKNVLLAREQRISVFIIIIFFLALFLDSYFTASKCHHPLMEGNIPLSNLMKKVGVKSALLIGIVIHIVWLIVWVIISKILDFIIKKYFKITLPIYRYIPVYFFMIRDIGEHIYGAWSWL
jgi:hypothetical protein